MRDQRVSPRSPVKQHGVAVLNGHIQLECTVRDLSTTGARLGFKHPIFLPKTFRLRLNSDEHRVSVVWQRSLFAGVRFQEPIRNAAAVPKKRRLAFWS